MTERRGIRPRGGSSGGGGCRRRGTVGGGGRGGTSRGELIQEY